MADHEMRVSIIIPIYNTEKYLCRCLDSVICQTYRNLEIILVDDGSTDTSSQICDEYASRDNRVKVIHQANRGLVNARKTGIANAEGEYSEYVDSDDWIEPDCIEQMISAVKDRKPDMAVALGHYRDYQDGRSILKLDNNDELEERIYEYSEFKKHIIPCYIRTDEFYTTDIPNNLWCYIFKTLFLKEHQNHIEDEITIGEDAACVFRCLLDAKTIGVKNTAMYHYQQNEGSMMHNGDSAIHDRIGILYKNMSDTVESHKVEYDAGILQRKALWNAYYNLLMMEYKKLSSISDEYLFPYSKVRAGSKVFVYGLGTLGREILKTLSEKKDKYQVMGCSDQGWRQYKGVYHIDNSEMCRVYSPDKIKMVSFDKILIAVTRHGLAEDISRELISFGVDQSMIAMIDEKVLTDSNLPLKEY